MEQEIHGKIKAVHSIPHQVHTATTTNGASIDTKGFESCEHIVHVSVALNGSFTLEVQQAPDNGSGAAGAFAAVPAAEVIGTALVISIADANKVFRIGSIGKERHQRVVLTETAANSAGVLGVTTILSNPRNAPTDEQYT